MNRKAAAKYDREPAPTAWEELSPLARGNLCEEMIRDHEMGPIPARAGEPLSVLDVSAIAKAYPTYNMNAVVSSREMNA